MAGSRLPATEGRLRMKKKKENREVDRSPHEKNTMLDESARGYFGVEVTRN